MKKIFSLIIACVFILFCGACKNNSNSGSDSSSGTGSEGQQDLDLLTSADLEYKGAFSYPAGDAWAYSGQAIAYYPEGDPEGSADGYAGSLYAAGSMNNEIGDMVGEISIPAPVIEDNVADLPKAEVLQPLTDITEGWKDNCTYNADCLYRDIDGLSYLPEINKIAWNLNDWYNVAAYDQDSLGLSNLDMTQAQGVWHVGERGEEVFHSAKTCNYLFKASTEFANAYLEGKLLIAGNVKEAGANGGSQGPTLFAVDPDDLALMPEAGTNLDALAILYYREKYSCVWNGENDINEEPAEGACDYPNYRGVDAWNGGAWLESSDKAAVLIVGMKGQGPNCYGTQEECGGDPCRPSKGYHGYPYDPQILFYSPKDFVEVLNGNQDPWTVLPQEIYSAADVVLGNSACAELGSAAYDSERKILYITEQNAGSFGETVVHVWEIK